MVLAAIWLLFSCAIWGVAYLFIRAVQHEPVQPLLSIHRERRNTMQRLLFTRRLSSSTHTRSISCN
jgi:hypothetical protein